MKVQTLKRSAGSIERECSGDLRRHSRNNNAPQHFVRAREYKRAVNAAKMDRMFAKPLIGNIGQGHGDSVTCSAINRKSLVQLASGSADGQVCLWDLATRKQMLQIDGAHSRVVTGICFDGVQHFYSCSDDGKIHQWSMRNECDDPVNTWRTNGSFKSMDHHWRESKFVTASDEAVQVWSPERSVALQTFGAGSSGDLWGSHDTVTCVRYHPAEHDLVAHASSGDRGIGFHDVRTGSALAKATLRMRANDLQWNPMEPMNFIVANDDYSIHAFDLRNLVKSTRVYKGHTGAVLSVGWSPTGREFVSGSYDKTIRIFRSKQFVSREMYHTKRMQRVWTVHYTMDNKFIVSGSDDSNLRLWKADASEEVGRQLTTREEDAKRYRNALINRYQHMPQVKRIHKARKVPKLIKKQTAQAKEMKEKADRKLENRIKYDKKGQYKFESEREKSVVRKLD